MKVAFLTSYPLDVGIGSGVVRMIMSYQQAMNQAGHKSEIIHPQFKQSNSLKIANLRLQFNRQLRHSDLSSYDLVIGSDFDGYALRNDQLKNFVALNAGILADLLPFETGREAKILRHLADREKQNVQQARKIFVPSKYTAKKIKEHYSVSSEKIIVVPFGIDSDLWTKTINRTARKQKTFKTILCVARQFPRKGVADLIEAFASVRGRYSDVKLQIIGGGPQALNNIKLAESHDLTSSVFFAGDVRNFNALAEFYRNADLFCLPSYHETFGLVFLEAMCAGLPIVSYASTSIPEVVKSDQGFLCEPGNIDQLTERLLFLLNHESRACEMGEAGIKRARSMAWRDSAATILENRPFPGGRNTYSV